MHRFYIPLQQGNYFTMDPSESHHCVKVLRMNAGDTLQFIDGRGGSFKGVISIADPKKTIVEVTGESRLTSERPYNLHIAIAPTKNIDRFEWFVEKAVEIGVDEITPLICDHSERKNLRADRLEKIAVSAMKQSLRAFLPVINPHTSLRSFLTRRIDNTSSFIAYCGQNSPEYLLTAEILNKNILVLIGPEGDFSVEEIKQAEKKDFKPISFGTARLRTETAGVVCAQVLADRCILKEKGHLKKT
jgi:16S rRNA (uracil1498-N3)-methyltransferase